MGRKDEEQRKMEADCSGGQSSPSAAAPWGGWEGRKECSSLRHYPTIMNPCSYVGCSIVLFYFYYYYSSGVRLSPLGTAATTDLLYQPQMIGDCGTIEGMKIGRGN
jgi:hypothetical protein